MDSNKRCNESEMGSGDSDDEFYNVKLPYTPETASEKTTNKIEVKKVYSPPRTKVQYDYKFDSSSDEESEMKSGHKNSQYLESVKKNSEKVSEKKEESFRENTTLPQNTFKVVEKINEELKSMKNSGTKLQSEKIENLTAQNHIAQSISTAVSVPRPSISVVPPVVVVPPPVVVPQTPVMGPMIVPPTIGMGGPMAMMPSQNLMGNMIRGPNPIGLAPNNVMGMNTVPGMMGMQGSIMGMPGGMLNPAALGGINMGMPGNIMRVPGANNAMFRMQGPGNNMLGLQGANNMIGISRPNNNIVGVPRSVNIPPPPSNLMVNNSLMSNPGGLMVMSGMMGNQSGIINNTVPGANQTGNLVGNSNMVQAVSTPQGALPVRVPPPPPFMNFRGRTPVPPGNFRWQANPKVQVNVPKTGSPTASSPDVPSPSSSPLDKSSRDYDGDEFSRDDKEKSPSIDTDESQSPPREIPNTFKNDGSFMEMFKKMTEESENNPEASSNNKSGNSETSDSSSTLKKPAVMLSGIVGKRRGGRVLKTGLVKKVKKEGETEEEKHPKDAWSMYMAEVKKYREASCEEEGKTRPLVEPEEKMDNEGKSKYRTIPFDPRFPNTNQTRNCHQNYVDYHRCVKKRGEDFEACQYFKRAYTILCPNFWIEKWDSQIEEGVFPAKLD